MKFYVEAVLTGKPARIHKNSSVRLVIIIEVRNGELLAEGRGEIHRRRKICARQCAFKPILRVEPGRYENQRRCHHELDAK